MINLDDITDQISEALYEAEMDGNLHENIREFHEKFDLDYGEGPRHLPVDMAEFRTQFMFEELEEYCDAQATDDLEGMFDALIDLVYVAIGTAYLHGFDFNTGWARVHAANMKKRRALRVDQSKRGTTLDVVKPEGWEPPRLDDLVKTRS